MKFYYCVERELEPDSFSSLIMRVIGAPYSHALILVEDIDLENRVIYKLPMEGPVVFHATIPCYSFNSLEAELDGGNNEIMFKIEIKVRNEFAALAWLHGNMGKEYSFSQCFSMIDFSFMGEEFVKNVQNIWSNGDGRGVCSEFPIRFGVYHSIRPDMFLGINPDVINPRQGLDIFQRLACLTA